MSEFITRWLGFDMWGRVGSIWLLGIVLAVVVVIAYGLRDYYKRYVEFIKGSDSYEPTLIHGDLGEAILGIGCGIVFWPIPVVFFFCEGFFTNEGVLHFLKYLNPRYLVKAYAIHKHKALILTSPSKTVRGLLKDKKPE